MVFVSGWEVVVLDRGDDCGIAVMTTLSTFLVVAVAVVVVVVVVVVVMVAAAAFAPLPD